jgi:hypothetical protein
MRTLKLSKLNKHNVGKRKHAEKATHRHYIEHLSDFWSGKESRQGESGGGP